VLDVAADGRDLGLGPDRDRCVPVRAAADRTAMTDFDTRTVERQPRARGVGRGYNIEQN
jgi:hypothetical protein